MVKRWSYGRIFLLAMVVVTAVSVSAPLNVAAAEEPKVALETRFPVLTGDANSSFSFDVNLTFDGPERQRFNVSVTPPQGWTATATVSFKQAPVVEIGPTTDPKFPPSESISVSMSPAQGRTTEPGDYVARLEVASATVRKSIDLTARVTARFGMSLITDSGKLNAEAEAGKDTHVALSLSNNGTAPIEDIRLSSNKPEGWKVTFNPERVDSLAPGFTQQVDMVINPPSGKSVAGDYALSVSARAEKASSDIDFRVTVKTPTIWGIVSIIIILVVIAGLVVLFKALGRR
ncbi:MAG: hypothetical protein HYX90_05825 [Chloroflexi bacterium]|nr:hypothetical protein [Chloroflexota bacterium]